MQSTIWQQNPSSEHVAAAKNVWRHVSGALDVGPVYSQGAKHHPNLVAFSGLDFAGNLDKAKSTTGIIIYLS